MIQTDATFNTIQLNLPLSAFVSKSNLNKPLKSKAQLALESKEWFERATKSEIQVRKEAAQDKNRAKRLEPRKEKVSQLLDDFPELLDDEQN